MDTSSASTLREVQDLIVANSVDDDDDDDGEAQGWGEGEGGVYLG